MNGKFNSLNALRTITLNNNYKAIISIFEIELNEKLQRSFSSCHSSSCFISKFQCLFILFRIISYYLSSLIEDE